MKQICLVLTVTVALMACNNNSQTEVAKHGDSATVKTEYAYTTDHPVDWEWGSTDNIKTAMLALKAFENGDITECVKYFADTAVLEFDGFDAKLSRDSIAAFLKQGREMSKSITIKMDDYESVRSKDSKAEYVTLWYKQISEDKTGKKDSVECTNDIKFKDGKIVLLNEKTRHYMPK